MDRGLDQECRRGAIVVDALIALVESAGARFPQRVGDEGRCKFGR